MLSKTELNEIIRDVPDFPKPGIVFKDITPLLAHPDGLRSVTNAFLEQIGNKKIDYVCGIESRGFLFGTCLAEKLQCGFIPIRKPGKLPFHSVSQEYQLEYGSDKIEIHTDAFQKGDSILVVDDLLATGGTAQAASKLIEKLGGKLEGFLFVIELAFLEGRKKLGDVPVISLLEY